jgi:DNA replication protein DnaC
MTDKPDWREVFLAACDSLPEHVTLPYELTPEGGRSARFMEICPEQFRASIERSRLTNTGAFDEVLKWSGAFPGPCLYGKTGTAKTRAAWRLLHQLFVRENRTFAWFPVKRLITEFEQYEAKNLADEFYRQYNFFNVLFVDDVDKINWQFESQAAALFSFYDWIYRTKKPCITTTNKDRKWWADKMGDAFTRRLFNDAHFSVLF